MKKLSELLRSPEEEYNYGGGGGGSDVFDDSTTVDFDEDSSTETVHAPGQEPAPSNMPQYQQPQQPASIPIDQLPQLIQALQPQGQQPQQPQLTQEEIDQRLKRVKITPEIGAMFFGESVSDAQLKSLQMFVDSIVEHANTVNGYALHAMQERMNQRYSPALQHVEHQKTQLFTSALTEDFPALRGRENVINMVVQSLKQQGFVARDGNHAAQVVAANVEQLIKQVDPSFTLAVQHQQQQRQQNMPSMPGIPAGAGGQASGGGHKTGSNKPAWLDVFVKR